MILYDIDAIGPKPQRSQQKQLIQPIIAHPSLLVSDYDKSPVQQLNKTTPA